MKISTKDYRTEGDLSDQHNFPPDYPEVQDTLIERQKTHGEFTDNARVMQQLKNIARDEPSWTHMSYVQRESIEMIFHKIGRIVTGNPNESDHWLDIEGYARLARERLEK